MSKHSTTLLPCLLLASLSLNGLIPTVWAHRISDSFLQLDLSDEQITGRWDIPLRDLHQLVGLDQNGDLAITWGELKAAQEPLAAHALAHLRLETPDGDCPLGLNALRVIHRGGHGYAALSLDSHCSPRPEMVLHYSLLFLQNPEHQGLLTVQHSTGVSDWVLSFRASSVTLTPRGP